MTYRQNIDFFFFATTLGIAESPIRIQVELKQRLGANSWDIFHSLHYRKLGRIDSSANRLT